MNNFDESRSEFMVGFYPIDTFPPRGPRSWQFMKNSARKPPTSYEDFNISVVAYRLWNQNGRPVGRFAEFWVKAENLAADAQDEATAKPPSPPISPGADLSVTGPQ